MSLSLSLCFLSFFFKTGAEFLVDMTEEPARTGRSVLDYMMANSGPCRLILSLETSLLANQDLVEVSFSANSASKFALSNLPLPFLVTLSRFHIFSSFCLLGVHPV